MPDDYTEVLVAIGRIEEGIRYLREDMTGHKHEFQAQKQEVDSVKADIHKIELDVNELKTQRNSSKTNIALMISLIAVGTSVINLLLP